MYNDGMRFEVPQFIEIEDKIIGPFTWKQFVYLAGGTGIVVITFLTLPFFLFLITGVPVAILAGFLAFHQVNKRPFADFLESVLGYTFGNKLYLWRKKTRQTIEKEDVPQLVLGQGKPEKKAHLPTQDASSISSLSRKLEIDALEIKE